MDFASCAPRCSTQAPSELLELLGRVANVVKDYCGVFNEEAIRKNFILVYELLDEMLDYGYPQITTTEGLKNYIHNEPVAVAKIYGSSGRVPGMAKPNQAQQCRAQAHIGQSKTRQKPSKRDICRHFGALNSHVQQYGIHRRLGN